MPVFIVWTRQEAAKNTTTHLLNPTSNMSIPMTELEVIKRAIRECHMTHVEQLRDLDMLKTLLESLHPVLDTSILFTLFLKPSGMKTR